MGSSAQTTEALALLDLAEEVEALRLAEKAEPGKSGGIFWRMETSEPSDMKILLVV